MQNGVYIHIPFCASKCPYCDFYSLARLDAQTMDAYTDAVLRAMQPYAREKADTVYFGGGTPSLLGGERIVRLIQGVRDTFTLSDTAEITMEANPADDLYDTFAAFAAAGGNRLSLGMQSSDADILKSLGRRHTCDDVHRTVQDARRAGIGNISLDLMLAVSGQTQQQVRRDVQVCADLGAQHVSAYLLKIEPNTPFDTCKEQLCLPDEDETVELYMTAAECLEQHGYAQYEISNFAQPEKFSRHNYKYWDLQPYIGLGAGAHGFHNGTRYAYPRDINAFIRGDAPITEPPTFVQTGSLEEYALLRLRLCEGLRADLLKERFGKTIPDAWIQSAKKLPQHLVRVTDEGISLTREGFLLSNTLIGRILNL